MGKTIKIGTTITIIPQIVFSGSLVDEVMIKLYRIYGMIVYRLLEKYRPFWIDILIINFLIFFYLNSFLFLYINSSKSDIMFAYRHWYQLIDLLFRIDMIIINFLILETIFLYKIISQWFYVFITMCITTNWSICYLQLVW